MPGAFLHSRDTNPRLPGPARPQLLPPADPEPLGNQSRESPGAHVGGGMAVLNLTVNQLDGLLTFAALCRGDRDPLGSLIDLLLEERTEVDEA